ncbi:MAG: DUF4349 domain-containing protein [Clostridia bacterium]|nr:DUF4349 domain-containing protein [Clostridia bacterium]
MRCSKVRKLSFKFYEEALSDKDMDKIKEHLKDCPWCASEYKKVRKMMNAVENDIPKIVPEALHKNIMIEVDGQKSFAENEKRENKIAIISATRKAVVACAAVFIVCFALSFVDFDMIKEEGLGSLKKVTMKADEAIEKEKLNNTKEKSLTALDLLVGEDRDEEVANTFTSGTFSESATAEETSEELSANTSLDLLDTIESNEDDTTDLTSTKEKSKDNKDNKNKKDKEDKKLDKQKLDELISKKGFALADNYEDQLSNDDLTTKKAILELYTSSFDKALNETVDIASKYNANIYYQNIYYNEDSNEDYRTCVLALRVMLDNFNKLKSDIEKLGTYDINVMQEEVKIETKDELNYLLSELKEQKLSYETELEELDSESDNYETRKNELNSYINESNEGIQSLETRIENMSSGTEIVKMEITFNECSELDIDGILSGKAFSYGAVNGFKTGWERFARCIQNILLWICENILFIISFIILFIIVFFGLKSFIFKDKE